MSKAWAVMIVGAGLALWGSTRLAAYMGALPPPTVTPAQDRAERQADGLRALANHRDGCPL